MSEQIGPYRLDGVIGVGGMGTVHAATDLRLGRRVALKIVLGHHASSPEFTARFQREAAVLARLDSPHVVAIYDHGEHQGHPYIAMQYAAGGDLGHLLQRRGAMPLPLAARVCAQVADALVAAHAVGVVHRDVKPANVLLRDDRVDRLHVYLSDFGVALTEASGLTSPGAIAGTWNYLAPERTRGEHGSPASDLYSVGCLFHELVTGRPPYAGTDVEVAMEHLSSPVPQLPGTDDATRRANRVLALSMAKEPHHRYPSAAVLRDELRELVGSTVDATPLPGPPPHGATAHGSPGGRRRRALVVAGVVALVAALGVGTAIAVVASGDDTPSADPTPSGTGATSGPTDGPAGPTDGPTPTAAGDGVVLGDLDGDGLGDIGWADFDRSFVVPSSGSGFGAVGRRAVPGKDVVTGEFTGDDRPDLVAVEGDPPSLVATIHDRGRTPLPGVVLDVPEGNDDLDLDFIAADVDGDGVDDLVVATPIGTDRLELNVALNTGDGSFERPQRWFRGELDPRQAGWAVGDFDDDGDDDLVHYASVDQDYTVSRAMLLASSGTDLEVTGFPLQIPEQFGGSYFSLDEMYAGDVDGDDRPELVGLSPYGMTAIVWEWTGQRFLRGRLWTDDDYDRPGGGGVYGVLSDVDGDGLADVVTVGTDGQRVHLSTGQSFRYAPRWRDRTLLSDNASVIGAVALGIF